MGGIQFKHYIYLEEGIVLMLQTDIIDIMIGSFASTITNYELQIYSIIICNYVFTQLPHHTKLFKHVSYM